VKRVEALL